MRRLIRWSFKGAAAVSAVLCVDSRWKRAIPPLVERLQERATLTLIAPVRVGVFGQSASVYNQAEPYRGDIIGISNIPRPSPKFLQWQASILRGSTTVTFAGATVTRGGR